MKKELTIGSEKQINWANEIRNALIERCEMRIEKLSQREGKEDVVTEIKDRLSFVIGIENAAFVIEYRATIGHGDVSSLKEDYETWK